MKRIVLALCALALVAAAPVVAAPSATTLQLTARGTKLAFDKRTLTAPRGRVTLVLRNLSPIPHNVAIRGNGVNVKGKIVPRGGTSRVSATLRPGRYLYYCSVPGHLQAGMKGTLTVR